MPPHCDTLDGPVVKAARMALETGNVNYILPWVPKEAKTELKKAFEKALLARKQGKEAKEIADLAFPNLEDKLDYIGFKADSELAVEWSKTLFTHYWNKATPQTPDQLLNQ